MPQISIVPSSFFKERDGMISQKNNGSVTFGRADTDAQVGTKWNANEPKND
jgi:hypothetical protein